MNDSTTMRITLGVDPGIQGAIAVLADGDLQKFIDMPTVERPNGGNAIDAHRLAATLRGVMQQNPGAFISACLERISTRPTNSRTFDQRAGEGLGIVKGVLGALGVPWAEVTPQLWKKYFALIGTEKDVARLYAMQRFPRMAQCLSRKKDNGRADAALIALWAWDNEKFGPTAGTYREPDMFAGRAA
jgi:crossover junction endodeoxyribonuclease RuvC